MSGMFRLIRERAFSDLFCKPIGNEVLSVYYHFSDLWSTAPKDGIKRNRLSEIVNSFCFVITPVVGEKTKPKPNPTEPKFVRVFRCDKAIRKKSLISRLVD
ncbi:hypothetical protein GWI33_022246 [Rhynchophorus ferrugineus]|uniref:Uncharacterized protein n=1 Tax=Rhynchophorus ferrugineus TaxID=354439 RepID=A0A834MML0_RHYFE|nr:hypothetical protein GWI33_022246 [Rhynchophorus ferrugineus]